MLARIGKRTGLRPGICRGVTMFVSSMINLDWAS